MAQDDYIKLQVRVPKDLHTRIQAAAESGSRSLNSELIARLDESFSHSVQVEKLQNTIETLEGTLSALSESASLNAKATKVVMYLLRHSGALIKACLEFMPNVNDEGRSYFSAYADAIENGDWAEAAVALRHLADKGREELEKKGQRASP